VSFPRHQFGFIMNSSIATFSVPVSFLAPTLAPSIVFSILFGLATILFGVRCLKIRRQAYYCLFGFALLRTASYISRGVWSQDPGSKTDAIVGGVISAGGFFLAAEALYILFYDWIITLYGGAVHVPPHEGHLIRIIKILLPVASALGIFGSVKQFTSSSQSDYDYGTSFRKASTLGFTILILSLIGLTMFFTFRHRGSGNSNLPVALIMGVGCLLLLIELVYRLDSIWSDPTKDVNKQKWVFYVFSSVPEILFCLLLGVVNLETIFYDKEVDHRFTDAQEKREAV